MTTDDNLEKRLAVAEARVDAVRALADEWVKTRDYLRKRSPAGSTRPDQSADRREANALDAAAASVFAALDAVEPADQPHPTPEAKCGEYVGQGWDQEGPCWCVLNDGHDGPHLCSHTATEAGL